MTFCQSWTSSSTGRTHLNHTVVNTRPVQCRSHLYVCHMFPRDDVRLRYSTRENPLVETSESHQSVCLNRVLSKYFVCMRNTTNRIWQSTAARSWTRCTVGRPCELKDRAAARLTASFLTRQPDNGSGALWVTVILDRRKSRRCRHGVKKNLELAGRKGGVCVNEEDGEWRAQGLLD